MAVRIVSATGGLFSATTTWTAGIVPTSADDVQANSTSGPFTIDAGAACRSFDLTGAGVSNYSNTLTHSTSATLTIGDATAGLGNIALAFPASGFTYTLQSGATPIAFVSTSATVQTISFNGYTTGSTTYNATSGGSWKHISGQVQAQGYSGSQTILTKGTLDINSQTMTWNTFISTGSSVRSFILGAATINMNGGDFSNNAWNIAATNLTFSGASSTINFTEFYTASAYTFSPGVITYGTINITVINGNFVINSPLTCGTLLVTGAPSKTFLFQLNNTVTCSGTVTITANSSINRVYVASNTTGTPRSLSAATVSLTNVDFIDITGTGAAIPFTGTSLGDAGGNSNITFDTPVTQTWSGTSGGNWSTNAWTTRVPLPQDNVNINTAFSASQTVTADMPRLGSNISWLGATGAPSWLLTGTNYIFSSLTLAAGMTIGGAATLRFAGRGTHTITSNGVSLSINNVGLYAPGGTYTLQDNYTSTTLFDFNTGTWNMNNFNITTTVLTSNVTNSRTLIFGTGTWNINSTSGVNVWLVNTTSLTVSGTSGTINIANASSATRTFGGAGTNVNYGTLNYTVAGSTGTLIIQAAQTFTNINFSDATNARTLTLPITDTTIVTGNFNVNGTAGKLITINSPTSGTAANLSKSSGTVSSDYLSIKDSNAIGGANWYAGANSTNVSNNTGWIFTAPPVISSSNLLTMGVG
jgi:hypothetical protein